VKKRSRKREGKYKADSKAKRKRKPKKYMSNTTILILCVAVPLLLGGFANYFAHKWWILYLPLTGALLLLGYLGHLAIRSYVTPSIVIIAGSDDPSIITPDSQPRPQTSIPVPADKFLLILGDFVAWKSDLPMVALMQREEPLITLNKEPHGMSLSAKFFSADGKIIAEIDRNEIHPNPANFWRLKKDPKDAHRLTVFNDEAKVVIDVQYLNPRTIKILGRFFAREGTPIALNEDGIELGPMHLSKSSAGEIGKAALGIP
jgi:hypothetical protein